MTAPFVKEMEDLGLDWALTLKENRPESLREGGSFIREIPAASPPKSDQEVRWWRLPEVDWPVADRLAPVVKKVRVENQRSAAVDEPDNQRTKIKTAKKHQFLRRQIPARLDTAAVHLSTGPLAGVTRHVKVG